MKTLGSARTVSKKRTWYDSLLKMGDDEGKFTLADTHVECYLLACAERSKFMCP